MRRLVAVLRRDVVASRRDPMVLLLLGSSLLFALLLRTFLGGFEQVGASVVVSRADAVALAGPLRLAVDVVVVADDAAVRGTVADIGDVMGVVKTAGGYSLLLAGDEPTEVRALGQAAIDAALGNAPRPSIVSVGDAQKPLLSWLAVFYGVAAIFLGGVVMAFNVIEDKEMRTMQALGITPLTQREYLGARSVIVLMLGLAFGFVSLLVIGASFQSAAVAAVLVAGVPFGVVAGFVLGALSDNVIQGIANLKLAWILVLLPGMASWFLPERWEYVLGALPQFWLFVAFRELLVERGGLSDIAVPVLFLVLTTALAGGIAYPLLRRRLAFATA